VCHLQTGSMPLASYATVAQQGMTFIPMAMPMAASNVVGYGFSPQVASCNSPLNAAANNLGCTMQHQQQHQQQQQQAIQFMTPPAWANVCAAPSSVSPPAWANMGMCATVVPISSGGAAQMHGMPYVVLQAPPPPPPPRQQQQPARTPLRKTAVPYISHRDRETASRFSTQQQQSAEEPEVTHDSNYSGPKTTLLFRNLPDAFTRSSVFRILRVQGLAAKVNFIYVPGCFKNKEYYGYAFVNCISHEAAEEIMERLHSFSNWSIDGCDNTMEVSWCTNHQGLEAHVERYRNSRIMHESVDDEYKPAVYKNGSRLAFPPPTRALRPPRLRKGP
jgi:hypothetical protein